LNRLGNDAFAAKKYDEAIVFYAEAIALDPDNAVFYSNRRFKYISILSVK
jgi:tetratricopeptide (TPR) repeat protein